MSAQEWVDLLSDLGLADEFVNLDDHTLPERDVILAETARRLGLCWDSV